ncbi:MAG: hypothetical protein V4692_02530 [Bdellovibrionota bacterium]
MTLNIQAIDFEKQNRAPVLVVDDPASKYYHTYFKLAAIAKTVKYRETSNGIVGRFEALVSGNDPRTDEQINNIRVKCDYRNEI